MARNKVVARAIARASGMVDQGALRLMERSMRRSGPRALPANARERLAGVAERYDASNPEIVRAFFRPPAAPNVTERPRAARAGAESVRDLSFASAYPVFDDHYRDTYLAYRENATAFARLYSRGSSRPAVICLHGWGGGVYWLEERAFLVSYLLRIGLDVALFQLPFHADRTPAQASRGGELFPGQQVVRTNEAFGQAIHDLRALASYLRANGTPLVGVMGMSLGGYTTALWATVDADLAFAFPIIPAVSMSTLMWRHGEQSPARRRAENAGVTQTLLDRVFAIHSPLGRPVLLPRERLLIVAGRGDRITPPDQARALWRHWDKPPIHWFPGGHLAQVGRGNAFRAIRKRLSDAGLL
jgi:pimeloyl-ACP methyl ester carboxylesterase